MLAACKPGNRQIVDAADYDSFWLWAGVTPQSLLKTARSLYLHYGEIHVADPARLEVLRPQTPRLNKTEIWLVLRIETLRFPAALLDQIIAELDRWNDAGNTVAGLQIDFDARTRFLAEYAGFLQMIRKRLPAQYRLSVTGLLDWSANGDPAGLDALSQVIDEIVVQTYQGRQTIPGYATYLKQLGRLRVPFKVGLVQGGEWQEPPELRALPQFRGFVVFLVNSKPRD